MKHKTRRMMVKESKQCQLFYKLEQKKSSNAKTTQGDIYSVPLKLDTTQRKEIMTFTQGQPVSHPTKVI